MTPEPPAADQPPAEAPPDALSVPLSALVDLGVEHWRLSGALPNPPAAARHAMRRIGDLLGRCELEVRSMDGHPFDAGLAVRVVHAEDDPALPPGRVEVVETVSPMVLWRGRVVRPADVVTRRGPAA